MFYVEQQLKQIPGIQSIHRHRKTSTDGRWSVVTTDQHFRTVRSVLAAQLSTWVHQYCLDSSHIIDPSFPLVGLAFKNPLPDSDSTGSFDTYLSSCATIYSNITMEDFPDAPPEAYDPTPQEWELHLSTPEQPPPLFSPPTSPPPIAYPEQTVSMASFNQLKAANEALTDTVKELQAQLQLLLAHSHSREEGLSIPPTQQTSESAHAQANMSLDSALSQMSHESD
jgi:hypothetical protein